MKKILIGLESKNYFQKGLDYEKAYIKKGLKNNSILKNDTIWKSKGKGKDLKLTLLEFERKKTLQKKDFFKNTKSQYNFIKNNIGKDYKKENESLKKLESIVFYNERKRKEREKAIKTLENLMK